MSTSARILVCGMPRSMTTWTFNVVQKLLRDPPLTLWIEPNSPREADFAAHAGVTLAKCHHYSDLLAEAASVILYSYRDIRMAAVSVRRMFRTPYSSKQVQSWIETGNRWMTIAHLVSRYETDAADPTAAVVRIRGVLAQAGVPLSNLTNDQIVDGVELLFRTSATKFASDGDSTSLIFPQHRTHSPDDPDRLSPEERAIYDRVSAEQAEWLRDFDYRSKDAQGQDVEHRLSELLLTRLCANAVVVDVGAARGLFSARALNAGASKVYGFEPLQRHMEYLRKAFRAEPRAKFVGLGPLAKPNASGKRSCRGSQVKARGRESRSPRPWKKLRGIPCCQNALSQKR